MYSKLAYFIQKSSKFLILNSRYKGHKEIVEMLVAKGASIELKDFNDKTALDHAKMKATDANFQDIIEKYLKMHLV